MAGNLFRVTVDDPNYSQVLKEPVELNKVRNPPEPLRSMDTARIWGINPGPDNERLYANLQPDDGLLFYLGGKYRTSGEGLYVAVGRIGKKFRGDEDSARTFFRNINTIRMFTVKDFELIEKSKRDIKQILGYEGDPQGSHRVREKHYSSLDRVMNQLRS